MAYIGKSPTGTGVRSRYHYTAAGSETSLSGADDNNKTLTFTDGEYVDVYVNGVLLFDGDYNTNTANTISGLSALAANDVVEIVVYDVFTVADTVSAKNGGTFSGNVTVDGAFTSQGIDDNATSTAMTLDSSGNLGIGETSPLGKFHIKSADSGVSSVSVHGDELVVEGSGNSGISILSGTSSQGVIYFGDSGDNNVAEISYSHSDNSMKFFTSANNRLQIEGDGDIFAKAEGSNNLRIDLRQGSAKCWLNYQQYTSGSVRDSYNISSVTDNGEGDFTATINNNMNNVNYMWSSGGQRGDNANEDFGMQAYRNAYLTAHTTGATRLVTFFASIASQKDMIAAMVNWHGDLA